MRKEKSAIAPRVVKRKLFSREEQQVLTKNKTKNTGGKVSKLFFQVSQ